MTRLEELDDWNGVQFSEVEDWCESERVAWGRLAHWAGEPLDEGRRPAVWTAFRKASGSEEAGEMKLPQVGAEKLSSDERRSPEAEAKELGDLWHELHELARRRSDCWEKRSQRADSKKVSMNEIESWSVQARDTWETLADWAAEPTEQDVRQRFEALAKSCR
jgi:hypothetical protein